MANERLVEYRKLKITLISASNLPKRRSRMKVYAMVRIGEVFETTKQTQTDMDGGTNPVWNCDMEYLISETVVQQAAGLRVIIKLYRKRLIMKDKRIGQVSISINELFNTRRIGTDRSFVLENGEGTVKLSYRFGDLVNGRARDWKQYISSGARRLLRFGGSVFSRTAADALITSTGILVPS